MKNLFDVTGRVIVITGATGVLGRAMVKHFAEQGAQVVILGRNEKVGNQLVEEAKAQGKEAVFYPTNVLEKNLLEHNYQQIMERYGRIDVLINGAGGNQPGATIPPDKTLFDLDIEAVRQAVESNREQAERIRRQTASTIVEEYFFIERITAPPFEMVRSS